MPVDDPVFRRTNQAQWFWYGAQTAIDEDERFELLRDVAEHNAMFWNPQGVDQVRQAREQTFKTDDKEFGKMVEELFGRRLDLPGAPQASHRHTGDFMDVLRQQAAPSEEQGGLPERPVPDAQQYLDMELDDIVFHPSGE